jgi:hypothetical protein
MKQVWRTTAVVVASSAGFLVLFGYFIDLSAWGLAPVRQAIFRWSLILAAVALWIGAGNLVRVHWRKLVSGRGGGWLSLVTLLSMAITLAVIVIAGPGGKMTQWVFDHIQIPVETSLLALLAIVIIYASIQAMRKRLTLFTILFCITAIVLLFGTTNWMGMDSSKFTLLREWILAVPVMAGARGMLLGIALGAIITGIRILSGFERPYEE